MDHYASGFYVRLAVLGSLLCVVFSYLLLPSDALSSIASIVKNLWVVLGPMAAFAIQIALQLMSIGEDRSITDSQLHTLNILVNERLRFVWDFTAVTLLSLVMTMSITSLNPEIETQRIVIAISLGLLVFTAIVALRFPFLFREIKDIRWELARLRRESESRAEAVRTLKAERQQPVPEIREPQLRNGTH